jgi:hypothetical protein
MLFFIFSLGHKQAETETEQLGGIQAPDQKSQINITK